MSSNSNIYRVDRSQCLTLSHIPLLNYDSVFRFWVFGLKAWLLQSEDFVHVQDLVESTLSFLLSKPRISMRRGAQMIGWFEDVS